MAHALVRLGTRRAVLVCGRDGLDEVSLCAPTMVREIHGGRVYEHEWQAVDFGLPECRREGLTASGPQESAARIRAVLEGQEGSATDIVLANAAAGLLAAERVRTLRAGIDQAREAIWSGRALDVLQKLASYAREDGRTNAPSELK
jgi:anthranilate phosphoribosyltransferase